jgi:hypothetical protein
MVLRIVENEADAECERRSLDDIVREGARQMLLTASKPRWRTTSRVTPTSVTRTVVAW